MGSGKRVFVVQGRSEIDMSPAEAYGELTFLAPRNFQVYSTQMAPVDEFWANLRDFNDDDFILLMGDPVLIGLATMVASEVNHGRVKLLKWDRKGLEGPAYKEIVLDMRLDERN